MFNPINKPKAEDHLRWYAVHTHPQQEDRAEQNLNGWDVETFSPKLKEWRHRTYTQGVVIKPLFPRYIFARFELRHALHKIGFTRGVHSVVSFGDGPVPVDDDIIELLRSRIGEDGLIDVKEKLRPGDKVLVKSGPLRNLVGVFERRVKHTDRVVILLGAIKYQGRIEVEGEHVSRV